MKKFLSLIVAVLFSIGLNAQTLLNEAVDFTALDYNGNPIHLFEILDRGQHVLLHITVRTAEDTPTVTPPLVEAYKALGCNQHDVFFIGVNANGTANTTQQFINEYGIEFPMIHNDNNSGSNTATSIYQTYMCVLPTTILISPDRSILLKDIYPIETAETVVNALAEFGIQEHECDGGGQDEEVGTSVIDIQVEVVSDTEARVIATPNAETVLYHYIVIEKAGADEIGHEATMQLLYEDEFPLTGVDDWMWAGLDPNTAYYVIAQGINKKGEWGEITKKEFTTKGDGQIELVNNTFKVYPNPASSEISIISEIGGEAEVNIYDMTGRCVKNAKIADINDATIDINDLGKGVYVININGSVSKLVVK